MKDFSLPHDHGQQIERFPEQMPAPEDFQTAAELFKQLGDGNRIRIFWLLCHCEECVINISSLMNMSSPAVSHHLRLLKGAGLICAKRDGKEMYYRASDTELAQALHQTIEHIAKITCPEK